MKQTLNHRIRIEAFTLIELMIVISIIAILAAMLFPAGAMIKRKAQFRKARTELIQLEIAIGAYKTRNGYFPPDNRQNFALNPLYFELKGSKLTGNSYQTLDNRVTLLDTDVSAAFGGGVAGFMNCTRGGGDDTAPAQDYLKEFKPGQYLIGTYAGKTIGLMTCTVQWSRDLPAVVPGFTPSDPSVYPNPWPYKSSNATNNVGQYDLWVDLIVGGKTNRISNWSTAPQVVYDP